MYEGSPSSIISPNDVTSNSISLNTTSPSMDGVGKTDLETLRNQVRILEADNLALRRAFPRLKDLKGRDVTDEMASLSAQLAAAEERLEEASNRCAHKHEELERLRSQYVEMEARKDEEIEKAIQRAIEFENENKRLLQELENDESRLFHLNQQLSSDTVGDPHSQSDAPSIQAVQSDISRRNKELRSQLTDSVGGSGILQHVADLNADSTLSSQASVIESGDARRRQNCLASTSVSDLMNIDGNVADVFNKTILEVTQDMDVVMGRMNALRNVCEQLFSKLSGTAEFLESLVTMLDATESEDARKIVDRIRNINFDLDKSMREAQQATNVLTRSQKSLTDLRTLVERTAIEANVNLSVESERPVSQADSNASLRSVSSAPASLSAPSVQRRDTPDERGDRLSLMNRVADLNKEIIKLNEIITSLRNSLNHELKIKIGLTQRNEELEDELKRYKSTLKDEEDYSLKCRQMMEKQCHEIQRQQEELSKSSSRQKEMHEILCASAEKLKFMEENEVRLSDENRELKRIEQDLLRGKSELEKNLWQKTQELESINAKILQLRKANLEQDKANNDLHRRHEELRHDYSKLLQSYQIVNKHVEEANKIVYQKVNEGLKELQSGAEDSLKEDVSLQNGHYENGVYGHEEFIKFLADCQQRTSRIVGLLKKSEEALKASKIGIEVPFISHMLAEARAVRLMLYKLHKFFHSQKGSNKDVSKRISGREICAELKRIYATMTSTKVISSPLVQPPKSTDRSGRPKGTGTTTVRDGTASDDASLRQAQYKNWETGPRN